MRVVPEAFLVEAETALVQVREIAENSTTPAPLTLNKYQLQRILRRVSKDANGRIKYCGIRRVKPFVGVRRTQSGLVFDGVGTCGSLWACPVCSERILRERGEEIRQASEDWEVARGQIVMLTLTVRHTKSEALSRLLDGLIKTWSAVTQSGSWVRNAEKAGVADWVRTVEVTYGTGWHPHLHVLLFIEPGTDARSLKLFTDWIVGRWLHLVPQQGLARPSRRRQSVSLGPSTPSSGAGYRLAPAASKPSLWERAESTGTYLTKASAVPTTKRANPPAATRIPARRTVGEVPSTTCWDLLVAAGQGNAAARRLWHEYVDATSGRHRYQWSQSGRARPRPRSADAATANLAEEAPPGDASTEATGSATVPTAILALPPTDMEVVFRNEDWDRLRRSRPDDADRVKAATRAGHEVLLQMLDDLGVAYETQPNAQRQEEGN